MTNLNYTTSATVSLPVSDLEKSARWYQDVLGLELNRKLDNPPWCEFNTAVAGLTVGLAEVTKVRNGDVMLSLGVENLDTVIQRLSDLKVDISKPVSVDGVMRAITILDLDGNALMLRENLDN